MKPFWEHYFKGGSIEAGPITEEGGRKKTVITLHGRRLIGPFGCLNTQRYIVARVTETDVRNVKIKDNTCITDGDELCSWLVSWEEK